MEQTTLFGRPVSRGVVIGEVLRYEPFQARLSETALAADAVEQALSDYCGARERARAELDGLEARLTAADPDKAGIMAAHREILLDPAMDEEIQALVRDELLSPDVAVARTFDLYAAVLGSSENERMKERASDLLDVKNRLLRCWAGEPERNLSALPKPVIVVADDLYPSDTATIDRANVLGIITQIGGGTSHTAIIARSYEIPAVLGVSGAMARLSSGDVIVLDAVKGEIVTAPTAGELEAYAQKAGQVRAQLEEERAYLSAQPVTRDGTRIKISLNVASANDYELSGAEHTDGCGLFRTEFLFLNGQRLPSEEEQYEAYQKVLKAFPDKPVILRTMDIGGDKQSPGLVLPKEENPFLGIRGLRLSLEYMDVFRTQVRAALRASAHGSLKVMMPMAGSLDEVRRGRAVFGEEAARLEAQGVPYCRSLEIGVMVEVPSIALIADLIVDEVDFISVGTNDLTQYLCAADRMNPAVKPYYQDYHPAIFRILGYLARVFGAAGKYVGVCGELAGDPLAIPALAGLGIRALSMGRASVAGAKRVLCSLDMASAQALGAEIQTLKTEEEIRKRLTAFAEGR